MVDEMTDDYAPFDFFDNDPLPGKSPEDVRARFMALQTEAALAEAYANACNKYYWADGEEMEYELDSIRRQMAHKITLSWRLLADELRVRIYSILRTEGLILPVARKNEEKVLLPFMKRNGFYSNCGWWEPIPKDTAPSGEESKAW